jgi:hypothetical protein
MRGVYRYNLIRVENTVRQRTNLLVWHREAERQRRFVAWRAERWASEQEELLRMLFALLILAIILLIASAMGGYIDLGLQDCAMRWIGTRTRDRTNVMLP